MIFHPEFMRRDTNNAKGRHKYREGDYKFRVEVGQQKCELGEEELEDWEVFQVKNKC